jgi:hypothetical protein
LKTARRPGTTAPSLAAASLKLRPARRLLQIAGYDPLRCFPVTNDPRKPGTLTGLAELRPDARPREGPENPDASFHLHLRGAG